MNLVPIDGRNPAQIVYYTLPEANMAPETIVSKRKVVFQPSISFSGAILVSGRVSQVKHVRQIASFTQEPTEMVNFILLLLQWLYDNR